MARDLQGEGEKAVWGIKFSQTEYCLTLCQVSNQHAAQVVQFE